MITITNISQFQGYLNGFLAQRESWYTRVGDNDSLATISKIRSAFSLIQNFSMMRHALEVRHQESRLLSILPSNKGKQAAIHERMKIFINQCVLATKNLSSPTGSEYVVRQKPNVHTGRI